MLKRQLIRFYLYSLISYWLVVLVVIMSMLPVYRKAVSTARVEAVSQTESFLQTGLADIQRTVEVLSRHAASIYYQNSVASCSRQTYTKTDAARCLYDALHDSIRHLWAENANAAFVTVQFSQNPMLLTNQSVYEDKRFFYDNFFHFSDLSYEEWQAYSWDIQPPVSLNDQILLPSDGKKPMIVFNYYFPSIRSPQINISYYFEPDFFLNKIKNDTIAHYGDIALSLFSGGAEVTLDYTAPYTAPGEKIVFSKAGSFYQAQISIAPEAFSENTAHVHELMRRYLLISIASAVVLSLTIAFLCTRPLGKLSKFFARYGDAKLADTAKGSNIYQTLTEMLEGVIDNNEDVKNANRIIQEDLSNALLRLAISGARLQETNVSKLQACFPAFSQDFYVLAIKEDRPGASPHERRMTAEKICALFQNAHLCEEKEYYVFIPAQENGAAAEIRQRILARFPVPGQGLNLGLSALHKGITAITTAAAEAKKALFHACISESELIRLFDSLGSADGKATFQTDAERFSWLLSQGTEDGIANYFSSCYSALRNCFNPLTEAKLFYYAIQNIIHQQVNASHPVLPLSDYNETLSIDDNLQRLEKETLAARDILARQRQEEEVAITQKLLDLIHQHIKDPFLSLSLITDECGISERYAYALIQEKTGQSYINYVLDLKISMAKKLLLQTDRSVKEIAADVGYDRLNSFFKIFKKKVGCSPTEYRSTHSDNLL